MTNKKAAVVTSVIIGSVISFMGILALVHTIIAKFGIGGAISTIVVITWLLVFLIIRFIGNKKI